MESCEESEYSGASFPGNRIKRGHLPYLVHEGQALPSCKQIKRGPGNEAKCSVRTMYICMC